MKPTVGTVCWTELATNDVASAKKFYASLFGWQYQDVQMPDMTYTLISKDDNQFGGIWQIPNDQKNAIPPHWMPYLLVDKLETTLKKATENGATIKVDITPAGDKGLFAIIIDPTGAYIALWEGRM